MRLIEIRTGLRKLEFGEAPAGRRRRKADATVEFVRNDCLRVGDIVRIELGVKEGLMRELIGRPELVNTQESSPGVFEYHYRLQAPIVATARTPH